MHFLFFLLYTKLHCLLQVSSQTEHCSLPCSRGCVILVEPVCPRFPFSPLCLPSCLQLLLVGVLQLLSPMLMKYRAWKIAFAVPMRELGECWWVVGGNLCILWDSSHSPDEVHWESTPLMTAAWLRSSDVLLCGNCYFSSPQRNALNLLCLSFSIWNHWTETYRKFYLLFPLFK